MTLNQFVSYLDAILEPENFESDISLNGVQVQNSDKDAPIKKIAFAVDACYETARQAIEHGADVLVVHHGLFWGKPVAINGPHYDLIKLMIENNLALYACHIPLDANKEVGNNYGLARKIGLSEDSLEGFGKWRGMTLGVKGSFENARTIDEIKSSLFGSGEKALSVLPFGKKLIKTVGIISGGAWEELDYAIEENLDLYITGEVSHQVYHQCLENKINFIAGGHYQTETMGVSLLKNLVEEETNLETVFIDVPTGL